MPLVMGPNTSGVAATTTAIAKETRWRNTTGGDGTVLHYPEAASADFKKGELVKLSFSSNLASVTQIATAPAALAVSSSVTDGDLIVGMALADSTGTTGTNIPILLADDNTHFLLRIYATTAAAAQLQDVAVGDLAELFRYLGTVADTQTVISAAANGTDGINQVMIVERPIAQGLTDEYAWAWVKVRAVSRSFK